MKDQFYRDSSNEESKSQPRLERMPSGTKGLGLLLLCFNPLLHGPSGSLPGCAKVWKTWSRNTSPIGTAVGTEVGTSAVSLPSAEYLSKYDAKQKTHPEDFIEPLVGSFSIEGQDPDRYKVNQDAYIESRFCLLPPEEFPDDTPWCFAVAGVMDGHGSKGHILVDFLKERLPERLNEQLYTMLFDPEIQEDEDLQSIEKKLVSLGQASPEDFYLVNEPEKNPMPTRQMLWRAMSRAFHLAQLDAQRDKNIATSTSGCTCILSLFNEKLQRAHIAHVGDSVAITASVASDAQGEGDITVVKAQSVCHTDFEYEQARIERAPDGYVDGVHKVCRGHLCVPMTRSLGNTAMLAAGVLPTPIIEAVDLFEFHLENRASNTKYAAKSSRSLNFLALCTDGVSDVMSNEEVVQIAGKVLLGGGGVQAASEAVAVEARRRWVEPFPGIDTQVDDITVTIFLMPPPKPSARDYRELADRVFSGAERAIDLSVLYEDAYHQVRRMTDKAVKLGAGQHGETWKAELSDGSDTYAVKTISLDDESRGFQIVVGEQLGFKASGDLQRKARRLANNYQDDHVARSKWLRAANNIVKYLHLAEDWAAMPEVCYVVMEYVEGQGLDKIGKNLSEVQRLSVYIKVAEIIELLSTNELGTKRAWVHRDIKPENIIASVKPDGEVNIKLVDLGVILDRQTRSKNFFIGTDWAWVPFEQRKNPGNFAVCDGDCISGYDMFSLGIMILQLECGLNESRVISNPEDDSSEEAKKRIEDFLATDLGKIAEQLTAKDPCHRPRAPALLESLQLLHDGAKVK